MTDGQFYSNSKIVRDMVQMDEYYQGDQRALEEEFKEQDEDDAGERVRLINESRVRKSYTQREDEVIVEDMLEDSQRDLIEQLKVKKSSRGTN